MFLPVRVASLTHERLFAALSPEYRNVINVVLEFDGIVDADRLSRALRTAIAAEPMWGYRFVEHWWQPYWQRLTGNELRNLVTVQPVVDVPDALRELYRTSPDTACQATILRGPDSDTVDIRIDH
ncbi:MAG TPA: hypothetical protein VM165_03390, partial [Planctomycetaceae bacterium]|nr:hypothetical protein [Planctomycetaceae bacterium]